MFKNENRKKNMNIIHYVPMQLNILLILYFAQKSCFYDYCDISYTFVIKHSHGTIHQNSV